jgi:mono/diheme cytochrome c family protein
MRVALLAALALAGASAAEPLAAQHDTGGAAFATTQPRATAPAGAPTFYRDVLPILQQNCQSCHQEAGLNMGGMVAPFPLLTYDDAAPRARRIANAVSAGRMPPWSAAEWQHGMFKDERFLEEAEKETIVAWAEAGTPAGDPAHAPPTPDFVKHAAASGGWSMGEPDLILEFAEPYCMDDDLRDIYVNIPVQITADMLPEDKWIESVEYRNGPAVHHIISAVGGLVPGMSPHYYPEGYGRVFRAGPREVVFNMHFNKEPGPGTALCTNIQAGIRFKQDGEVIRHVTRGEDLRIRGFSIPPGDPSYSASTEYTFEEDVELMSFMPHMHLRGKAALYEVTYPDGKHETLLHVPKYDFNWQHTYDFREPKLIPAGSVLRFTLWWDNSAENPANPDPTATVTWGLPTHAEMSQGYMSFQPLQEVHLVVGEPIPADLSSGGDNEAN